MIKSKATSVLARGTGKEMTGRRHEFDIFTLNVQPF